jgi:ferredoxin--NADP+ reductase
VFVSLVMIYYNAVIVEERVLVWSVMVLRWVPDRATPPPKPGQWLELGLGVWERVMRGAEPGSPRRFPPEGLIRRAYSISSPILDASGSRLLDPGEMEGTEFFLSLVLPPAERSSRVPNLTGRLFGLRPGDRLFISDRPQGEYTLDPVGETDDVLFLATGTGEAPHNFMIWELLRRGHRGRIASIVSVRHREDLAYDAVHRRLAEMFPGYRYLAMATRDGGSPGRHLQDLLLDGSLERAAGFPIEPGQTQVYLCGNPGMIGPPQRLPRGRVFPGEPGLVLLLEERRGMNADLGRPPVNVHYERFW